ncbi:MAG: YhjD/YihY/BrkB family envelope integrity protein, partial [Thermoguttaceae bacterium]
MFHQIWSYIRSVLQKTWEGWQEHDGFLLSAAMAYYAAFSLFPLCLVLISILGFVLHVSQQAHDAQGVLLDQVKQSVNPWLADQLQALLADVRLNAGLGGPLGAVTLLAAAIVVFLQLDYMFSRIFGATKTTSRVSLWGYIRTVLYDRLAAFLMLIAVGALLISLFLANVYVLARVRMNIENELPGGVVLSGWAQFLFNA